MNTEKIAERLRARLAEIVEREGRVSQHTKHRDEPLPADFAEQAVELENAQTLIGIDRGLMQEIRDIRHALERIENGTYGDCEACGEPIGDARHDAVPATSHCIDCAS